MRGALLWSRTSLDADDAEMATSHATPFGRIETVLVGALLIASGSCAAHVPAPALPPPEGRPAGAAGSAKEAATTREVPPDLRRDRFPTALADRATCGGAGDPGCACWNRTCQIAALAPGVHLSCYRAVCDVSCPHGNCVQRCAGPGRCTFTCDGGKCMQECAADARCQASCDGGACRQVCRGSECHFDCAGAGCEEIRTTWPPRYDPPRPPRWAPGPGEDAPRP